MNEIGMHLIVLSSIIVVGLNLTTASDVLILGSTSMGFAEQRESSKVHCRYSKAFSMLQVRCSDPKLEEIPRDLNSNIQILDASSSRIRDLHNDSFSSYTKLAYIYLGDNFIQNIEESAFARQYYLEVLDLTKNGCDNLPKNLFQLPYLRKVYLSVNKFGDSVFQTEQVTSPLDFLQLHRNKLTKLPEMGYMPTLTSLNVSENMIGKITTKDLARFCKIKKLDATKNPLNLEEDNCECVIMRSWLKLREIVFKPDYNCTPAALKRCGNVTFSNETLTIYDECMNILRIQIQTKKARNMWIIVASCAACFIFIIFLILLCMHRRNKRKKEKLKKEQQRIAANNANTQLLNSNLKQEREK
ncbi:PREDICTED: toll-like receptor 3 isoform X1 [Polistes canadensis]|uniref:toll-like receptor 3 isoform X1 n=2 Tax=Polistes canadensis TaxID=91411 RepID=UPI000718AE91|nr:PREDICTED: toll-like receptor 3 isoform X1 [Polistes canadensis]